MARFLSRRDLKRQGMSSQYLAISRIVMPIQPGVLHSIVRAS